MAQASVGANALLQASGASADTTTAIAGMIADFPHPQHPFEMTFSAVAPLRLDEIAPALRSADVLTALGKRVAVETTYVGAFRATTP